MTYTRQQLLDELKRRGVDIEPFEAEEAYQENNNIVFKPKYSPEELERELERRNSIEDSLEDSSMLEASLLGGLKGIGKLGMGANTIPYLSTLLRGVGTGGSAINRALVGGANLLGANLKPAGNPFIATNEVPEEIGQAVASAEKQYPLTSLLSELGGITGATVAGGEALGLGGIGTSLPAEITKNALLGGGEGLLLNPQDKLMGALTGGISGGLLGGAGTLAANLLKAKGREVYDAAQRLNLTVPLGEAFSLPYLKQLSQNILPYVPFSGMLPKYQAIKENLRNKANQFIQTKLGESSLGEVNSTLQKALQKTAKEQREIHIQNYKDLNELANSLELGDLVEPNNYKSVAQDILQKRQQLSDAYPEFADINDPQLIQRLKKIVNTPNANFKNAFLADAKLNELIEDAYGKGEPTLGKIYGALKSAHLSDIENSAMKANNQDLINLWRTAKQHYAENVAPFETREMQKFMREKSDPDLIIQSFIKTGKTDRPTLLNKLLNKLSPQKRDQVGAAFLARGLDYSPGGEIDLNLNKVLTNFRGLGPQSRRLLLGNNGSQFIQDLQTINSEIPDVLANPSTGQTVRVGGTLVGTGLAAANPKAIPIMGVANLLKRALVSPKLQRSIVEGNVSREVGKLPPWATALLGAETSELQ